MKKKKMKVTYDNFDFEDKRWLSTYSLIILICGLKKARK